ncbi:MAG: exodeoxyribonuclease VII large subunit [Acidimicrobiales bacterium]
MARKRAVEPLTFDFGIEDETLGASTSGTDPGPAPRSRPDSSPEAAPATAGPTRAERLPGLDRRVQGLQLAREALASGRPPDLATRIGFERGSFPEDPTGAGSDSALSVGAFYERLRLALRSEFPDEVWVTGEIRKVTVSKGHRYIELADHDPDTALSLSALDHAGAAGGAGYANRGSTASLEVACWSREWPTIAAALAGVGVELAPGLVVRVRGRVSVWEAGARVRFSMSDIDVEALVGGIAAARRKLLAALQAEGLIDANRQLPEPLVPLRVGLVTSASSEAYRDFTGQLERSGLGFRVRLETSLVQGQDAPLQIAEAIGRLQAADLDVIVVVRGGGAKGDLAAFDHEAVARAIVTSRYPVWTGIGHTGDRSVADEIAHRALVTPTACGEALVDAVLGYLGALGARGLKILTAAIRAVDATSRELASRRSDLSRAARQEITNAESVLSRARARAERGAALAVERCESSVSRRRGRLVALAARELSAASHQVASQGAMLQALDPKRQLERGWSLTRAADGSVVRSVADVTAGDELTTVVVDGPIVSVAQSTGRDATVSLRGRHVEDEEQHGQ